MYLTLWRALAIHFQGAVDYFRNNTAQRKRGNIHIGENQSIEMFCDHVRLFQVWRNTRKPDISQAELTTRLYAA